MITDAAFPFFARRKRAIAMEPRNLAIEPRNVAMELRNVKEAPSARGRFHLWRRRELTTFQKCLAVHMYYASAERRQK
jgi:hypothetical protein